ncbi:hypothetical protein AGMMS50256_12940 [Betaproteobacteria bacterium]|nr:hypothetical protein AGMMS50256_12940 [Betaproteobacteria bacterium]
MATQTEKEEYTRLLRYLEYTLHELHSGVLYDANSANEKKCAELMTDTYRLEELAVVMGVDISEFTAVCRWHYERYPHYLGRRKHFGSYANYMEKNHASIKRNTKQTRRADPLKATF